MKFFLLVSFSTGALEYRAILLTNINYVRTYVCELICDPHNIFFFFFLKCMKIQNKIIVLCLFIVKIAHASENKIEN